MINKKVYITQSDFNRLKELIKDTNNADKKYLEELEAKLNRAIIVTLDKIPNSVITMNSKIWLKDMDSDEQLIYDLVYPYDANIERKFVSCKAIFTV